MWDRIKAHWERWLAIVGGIVGLVAVGHQMVDYYAEKEVKLERFNRLYQEDVAANDVEFVWANAFVTGAPRAYGGSALERTIYGEIGMTKEQSWERFAGTWERKIQILENAYKPLAECFKADRCLLGIDADIFCHNVSYIYQHHLFIKDDIVQHGNETEEVSITSAGRPRFNEGDILIIVPLAPNMEYLTQQVCEPEFGTTDI